MGPDGKTPHSWRVEILPFLDQQPLYDSYRMDEPWDSEHNLKIAQKQVSVFHDPSDNSLLMRLTLLWLVRIRYLATRPELIS